MSQFLHFIRSKRPAKWPQKLAGLLALMMAAGLALSAEDPSHASTPPAPALKLNLLTAPRAAPAPAPAAADAKPADTGPNDTSPKKAAPAASDAEANAPHIALFLPLASKNFAKVADAIRLGFIAGALADGKNAAAYRIYTTDDEVGSLAALYRKAVADGAVAIVAGFTRDGANTIARESRFLPTLALNAPLAASENDLPEKFFYVSLNLDLEARLVARMAFNDGLRNAALLVANNALAKRIQDSFEKEWQKAGGELVSTIAFSNDPSDASRISRAFEKLADKVDLVFLAADPAAARFIRPYLPTGMPVFATSHTVDPRAEAVANLDLDNVRYLEMPWFVEQDHPAVMAYAKPAESLPVEVERLYALGIDAWRLMQVVTKSSNVKNIAPLDGVIGRLSLDGHQFVRALSAVEVRDGRSQRTSRPE